MSKKTLAELYEISLYSEWEPKDGGIYTVLLVKHLNISGYKIPIVIYMKNLTEQDKKEWFEKGVKNQFVRTVEHFKNSFKEI